MVAAQTQDDPATLGRLAGWGARALAASSASPRLDAELLLAYYLECPRSTIMAFPERGVPSPLVEAFRTAVGRRSKGVPVAHLTGRREFYSLDLAVSLETLVPRPETELLVELVLSRLSLADEPRVLDMGTGCGAIALVIKKERPRSDVTALDKSPAALKVAAANASELGLDIRWLASDWFQALDRERFDFIVSNPPYVEHGDPRLLRGDLRHEPRQALDGGSDGLDAFREILAGAPGALSSGGTLALEHGYDQAPAVVRLLRDRGFQAIETHRDLEGRDRVTLARVP